MITYHLFIQISHSLLVHCSSSLLFLLLGHIILFQILFFLSSAAVVRIRWVWVRNVDVSVIGGKIQPEGYPCEGIWNEIKEISHIYFIFSYYF